MKAQAQQLITKIGSKEPTRAGVIELLKLAKSKKEKKTDLEDFSKDFKHPEKIMDDINSYPQYKDEKS